jgi:DNA-binding SARP family transcriptional activator
VEVKFFGEFEAVEGGVPVPVRGAKQRTFLALLAAAVLFMRGVRLSGCA